MEEDSQDISSKLSHLHEFYLKSEGASVYPKNDERYKSYYVHINPMIENELVKHKIIIEERYQQSVTN